MSLNTKSVVMLLYNLNVFSVVVRTTRQLLNANFFRRTGPRATSSFDLTSVEFQHNFWVVALGILRFYYQIQLLSSLYDSWTY